nr:MAG TPA: hypothetical protein [Caudoviricetes sp.]
MGIVIDDELCPIVTEFIAEMLNDSRCESILLDVGEDARVDSDLAVLYLDIVGKQYGGVLSIVGEEYSASIRDRDTNETIVTVKGEEWAWGLRELLGEIKTRLRGDG